MLWKKNKVQSSMCERDWPVCDVCGETCIVRRNTCVKDPVCLSICSQPNQQSQTCDYVHSKSMGVRWSPIPGCTVSTSLRETTLDAQVSARKCFASSKERGTPGAKPTAFWFTKKPIQALAVAGQLHQLNAKLCSCFTDKLRSLFTFFGLVRI